MRARGTEVSAGRGDDWSRAKFYAPNYLLGALPDKGDLMHDPAMDEELERL